MGLDSIVMSINDAGVQTSDLTEEILDEFVEAGFESDILDSGHVVIRGKYYADTVRILTGVDMYEDLTPEQLQSLWQKLKRFIESIKSDIQECEREASDGKAFANFFVEILKCVDDSCRNILTPKELQKICDFFKVCADNNLHLRASW